MTQSVIKEKLIVFIKIRKKSNGGASMALRREDVRSLYASRASCAGEKGKGAVRCGDERTPGRDV
jgi:hypothetical protein